MIWLQSLSRTQFDNGAEAIAANPSTLPRELAPASSTTRWTWREHPHVAGFGFLERKGVVRRMNAPRVADDDEGCESEPEVQEEDTATLSVAPPASCTVTLSVCLSATFRVPVLYFTAHHLNGSPLPLGDILSSSIFHARSATPAYPFTTLEPANDDDDEPRPAPFLSQGDHPTLGTPAWFLHPCETEAIVKEVLEGRESPDDGWEREWLETWFMVVGSVVDLRE